MDVKEAFPNTNLKLITLFTTDLQKEQELGQMPAWKKNPTSGCKAP